MRASPAPLLPPRTLFPAPPPLPPPFQLPLAPFGYPQPRRSFGQRTPQVPDNTSRCSQGYQASSSPSPFPSNALNPSPGRLVARAGGVDTRVPELAEEVLELDDIFDVLDNWDEYEKGAPPA